jgi:hypothetical protein
MRQFEERVQEKPGKILFTVRGVYFNMIEKGEKKEEIRRASPYWLTYLEKKPMPTEAVFVSGPRSHRREITSIDLVKEGAEFVLGRPLSEQGQKDVGPGPVVVFRLGAEINHGRQK